MYRSVGSEAVDETCWTTLLRLMNTIWKRLLAAYVRYHHEDRTRLGLEKGTPNGRIRSVASGRVLSDERLGGLHHRYNRAAQFGSTFRPSLIHMQYMQYI